MNLINKALNKIDQYSPEAVPSCRAISTFTALGAGIGALCTQTLEGAKTGALAVTGLLAGTSAIRACAYTGEMSKKTLALITLVGATVLYRESLGSVVQTAAKSALDRLEPLNQTLFEDPIVNISNNITSKQPINFFVDSPFEPVSNNTNSSDELTSENTSSANETIPVSIENPVETNPLSVTDFKFSVWATKTKLPEGKEFSEWNQKYRSIVQNCSSFSEKHIEYLQCYDEGLTNEPTRDWIKDCIITLHDSTALTNTTYSVSKEHLASAKKACSTEDANGWGGCMVDKTLEFYI